MTVVAATITLVIVCVLLHYEVFGLLQRVLSRMHLHVRRRRILLVMFSLFLLHVVDVWLFGVGYWLLESEANMSGLLGSQVHGLPDFVYYSAVIYTTLGLGDLIPTGAIRFMTGTEAMSGFLLITWSASFTFLEMERVWKR